MPPNVTREIGLTAAREIRKNLKTTKGIALFVLFMLGGLGSLAVMRGFKWLVQSATRTQPPPEVMREFKLNALTEAYGEATARYLVDCPGMLYTQFQLTLFFFPLLILLVGFDVIAGETQHRTFRYLVVRAPRAAITTGKALGLWAATSTMLLVLFVTSAVAAIADGEPVGAVIGWDLRLWAFAAVYGAAYVGLTTLTSSLVRTPIIALLSGFGLVVLLGIARFVLLVAKLDWATWIFPSTYDKWLLSPDPKHLLSAIAILLAWGGACLAIAVEVVRRRDV